MQTNKIIRISVIFIISISLLVTSSEFAGKLEARGKKEGTILYVNNDEDFIFINLGRKNVKKGDFVEIYRGSRPIAAGSIKKVMEEMSEVAVFERDTEIKIGDWITTSAPQKGRRQAEPEVIPAPDKTRDTAAAALQKKLTSLQTKKSEIESVLNAKIDSLKEREKTLEEKVRDLERSKRSTEDAFQKELKRLRESDKGGIADLKRKLASLQTEKSEIESTLSAYIASLKNGERALKEKLKILEESKKSEEAALREQISTLEKSEKEPAAKLNERHTFLRTAASEVSSALNAEIASLKKKEKALLEKVKMLEESKSFMKPDSNN